MIKASAFIEKGRHAIVHTKDAKYSLFRYRDCEDWLIHELPPYIGILPDGNIPPAKPIKKVDDAAKPIKDCIDKGAIILCLTMIDFHPYKENSIIEWDLDFETTYTAPLSFSTSSFP